MAISAQLPSETHIPVTRIALFSSGVGFFEHAGTVDGAVTLPLPFAVEALDDVLKSLIVHDPGTQAPLLTYPSEETLERTLKNLKIDLSENPGLPQILGHLRGAELEINTSESITGRILGVETRIFRDPDNNRREEAFLSLSTPSGIRMIAFSEIASFNFTDPRISQDLNRALDLILKFRDGKTRDLFLQLPGSTRREVSFAYVIPVPVWKVSYRLDLSAKKPVLQGWAIVDNAGDTDWENVELSLVTGRPVSFIQNLYPPYHLSRPVLPLAIAGFAEAATYDSGYTMDMETVSEMEPATSLGFRKELAVAAAAPMPRQARRQQAGTLSMGGQGYGTPKGAAAGDSFSFTVQKPVSLSAQQSAMIPLVDTALEARKFSVFSGEKAAAGQNLHPLFCAELVNTTGMKLPAGPITVFDGGTYAGDALIEFLPEKEKRLIAFGEDLSVTGVASASSRQEIGKVTIARGVMTLSRKHLHQKTYTFKNAADTDRNLVVEHPFIQTAALIKPAKYAEKTGKLYRFSLSLGAGKESRFEVVEEVGVTETLSLTQLIPDALLAYSRDAKIPLAVRKAFETAISLKHQADAEEENLKELEERRQDAFSRQDRIRKNILAAGNTSSQGKDYLKRLAEEDNAIDQLDLDIEAAKKKLEASKAAYEQYLLDLVLDS